VDVKLTNSDFVTITIGVVIGAAYLMTKNWVLNNLFGIMFAIQGIENISVGNVKIGASLLVSVFSTVCVCVCAFACLC
jgi:minor histocompatibility antigen H13